MRSFLKKSLGILFLLMGGTLWAGCPSNKLTQLVTTLNGAVYQICYPSVAVVGVPFTIYVSISNPTGSTIPLDSTAGIFDMEPDSSQGPASGLNVTGVSPANGTELGGNYFWEPNDSNAFSGDGGKGALRSQTAGIPAGTTYSGTVTITPASTGTKTYTAHIVPVLGSQFALGTATINVLASCPTITASNATGATACGNAAGGTNFGTGNLNSFVSGGTSPYSFTTANPVNGSVSVNSSGIYSFTPSLDGPATGSFHYQASDVANCLSNTGTITVPISDAPEASNDVLFITPGGTPAVGSMPFTGGTPGHNTYTIVADNNVSNVQFDHPTTGQITITQTSAGPSYLSFNVTDANGCMINAPAIIYVYSCADGYSVAATLVNDVVYAFCYPSTAYLNKEFTITTSINNPSPTGTFNTEIFSDIVPFTGQTGPTGLYYDPGLSFVGYNNIYFGETVFDPTRPCAICLGGTGSYTVDGSTIPGNTTYYVTQTILPIATGLQQYSAVVNENPPAEVGPLFINVIPCPTILASNASFTGCGDVINGNLLPFVSGGSGPLSFTQAGTTTCDGKVVLTNDFGLFTYTASGATGSCTFQYEAFDINDCFSNIATVTVLANQGASANNGAASTCENTSVSGTLTATGGTPPYSFAIVTNGALGTATITNAATGAFTYVPNHNAFGVDTFTFSVTDQGCTSAPATITITIDEGPSGLPASATGCFNTAVHGNLLPFVTGGTSPFTFGATGSASGGAVVIGATGPYTFTPTAGFSGAGGFSYQITDTNSCIGTGAVRVFIDNLVALSGAVDSCNDTITASLTSFVSGGIMPFTFSGPISSSCAGGSVSVSPTGIFMYTAPGGFTAPCSFEYQVIDSLGCSSTGSVTLTANSSPTANNGTLNACASTAVAASLAGLVAGHPLPPLTFVISTEPTHGTISGFNATTGAYTYTPNAGYTGADSFQFHFTDSNTPPCTSNTATVTITVNPSPVATGSAATICMNTVSTGDLVTQTTGGTSPYTFAQTGTAVNGSVVIGATGPYTFTPTLNFIGTGSFQFYATDSLGCLSNVATNTIRMKTCCVPTDPFFALVEELYWGFTGA